MAAKKTPTKKKPAPKKAPSKRKKVPAKEPPKDKPAPAKAPPKKKPVPAKAPRKKAAKADFSRLRTYSENAKYVPRLVRALTGGPEERADAFKALSSELFDTNKWFSASPAAAELLLSALASGDEGGELAGRLLADVVAGGSADAVGSGRFRAAPDARLGASTRRVVSEAPDLVLAALSSERTEVAAAAALVLPYVPEALEAATADESLLSPRAARASYLFARCLADADSASVVRGLKLDALERAAVALAEMFTAGTVPEADLGPLFDAQSFDRFPWFNGHLLQPLAQRFGDAPAATKLALVRAVSAPLQQTNAERLERAAESLIRLGGFRDDFEQSEVVLVERLSPLQRACAELLARRDGIRLSAGNWGIPESGRDRRRWLGIDPPGPLEKIVSYGKAKLPLWKAWREEIANGDRQLPKFVEAALTPLELAEALSEVSLNGYGISDVDATEEELFALGKRIGKAGVEWAISHARALATIWEGGGPEATVMGASDAQEYVISGILVASGHPWTPELRPFAPVSPPEIAREVLPHLPTDLREDVVYQKSAHYFRNPHDDRCIGRLMPLIDLVPSERLLAPLRERLAHPRVREGLRPDKGAAPTPTGAQLADAYLERLAQL